MKKIILVFSLMYLFLQSGYTQLDFRRDRSFNPPAGIGSCHDAAILEDNTILVRHTGTSVIDLGSAQHDFLGRINVSDGNYYTDFWSEVLQSFLRNFTYVEPFIYLHGRGLLGTTLRIHKDGWIDTSHIYMKLPPPAAHRHVLHLPEQDKILFTGLLSDSATALLNVHRNFLLMHTDGSIDTSHRFPTLSPPISPSENIIRAGFTFADEISDKVYFMTTSQQADDHYSFGLFRLNEDWSIDTTFTFLPSSYPYRVIGLGHGAPFHAQKNGKIIVRGVFAIEDNGVEYVSSMIRLNHDGTYDPTFNVFDNSSTKRLVWVDNPPFNLVPEGFKDVDDVIHWKDDLYFLVGTFTQYQGTSRKGIVVINEDGFIVDEYFREGHGFETESTVPYESRKMIVRNDSLYVCGFFHRFDGELFNPGIIRLTLQDLSTQTKEHKESPGQLAVFPNPASHQLTVNLSDNLGHKQGSLRILNMQGIEIMNKSLDGGPQMQLNIAQLPPGIYRIQLMIDKELMQHATFIKQ